MTTISDETFARLIPDARQFLTELAADNSRDWFLAQKSRYDRLLKHPSLLMLDQLAHDLGRQSNQPVRPKLFRPQRDIRFSKDKRPYTTHLHMMLSFGPETQPQPGLFLGVAPDYVRIGGGLMSFPPATLASWRSTMASGDGTEMASLLAGLAGQGLHAEPPELKRVPSPYGQDHPHGDLLRRKGLTVWKDVDPGDFATPLAAMTDSFNTLQPLFTRLQGLT